MSIRRGSAGRDVVAIENQPAILVDGFVKRAFDPVTVDLPVDQGHGAQILQIHGAAVDAGQDAARRAEDFSELAFTRTEPVP